MTDQHNTNVLTDFTFANEILNKQKPNTEEYINEFLEQRLPEFSIAQLRDPVFTKVLDEANGRPLNIFQIGAIETLEGLAWRMGSGWSDIIWGQYIKQYGGSLTIVDINMNHLGHSLLAAQKLGYEVDLIYGDAIDHIESRDYDIYYLDGSNDPKEALDQYVKIRDKQSIVIIDDYNIKGTLIDKLKPKNFDHWEVFEGIAVIDTQEN